jgi:hypothetical protein
MKDKCHIVCCHIGLYKGMLYSYMYIYIYIYTHNLNSAVCRLCASRVWGSWFGCWRCTGAVYVHAQKTESHQTRIQLVRNKQAVAVGTWCLALAIRLKTWICICILACFGFIGSGLWSLCQLMMINDKRKVNFHYIHATCSLYILHTELVWCW